MGPRAFAVALVGTFPSAFAGAEVPARAEPGPPDPPTIPAGRGEARFLVVTSGRRLLAAGADSQLLLQNAVDWAVTATDLAGLRARRAQDPPLRPVSAATRSWVRVGNVVGPPLFLLLLVGLRSRLRRRRR